MRRVSEDYRQPPRLSRSTRFQGTRELKLSPAEQAAIRAAERALGYERLQRAPTTHPTSCLAALFAGAFAVWLALSALFTIGSFIERGISSMSNMQRASRSQPERGPRVASTHFPASAYSRFPQAEEPPRPSSVATQGAPIVADVDRDRGSVALAQSHNRQTGQQLREPLTILPLTGVQAAELAWPVVRMPEPARFRRFHRRRHSLLRRALGGVGQVLKGAAEVVGAPLQVWTEGLPGRQPQAFPYYAPQRAERRSR